MRATKHFQYGLLLLTPKEKKRKENYLHGKASNKQEEERGIFLGFHFNSTTSMEIKLTIFLVFLKVYRTHKKKTRNRNLN